MITHTVPTSLTKQCACRKPRLLVMRAHSAPWILGTGVCTRCAGVHGMFVGSTQIWAYPGGRA